MQQSKFNNISNDILFIIENNISSIFNIGEHYTSTEYDVVCIPSIEKIMFGTCRFKCELPKDNHRYYPIYIHEYFNRLTGKFDFSNMHYLLPSAYVYVKDNFNDIINYISGNVDYLFDIKKNMFYNSYKESLLITKHNIQDNEFALYTYLMLNFIKKYAFFKSFTKTLTTYNQRERTIIKQIVENKMSNDEKLLLLSDLNDQTNSLRYVFLQDNYSLHLNMITDVKELLMKVSYNYDN